MRLAGSELAQPVCIDELIKCYLSTCRHGRVRLGRFEAETEAHTLQKLVLRHSEAVILLARHDR